MPSLLSQILLYLCSAFAFGLLVGWLTKHILATHAAARSRETWEERLRCQRQELEAAQQTVRKHSAQLQNLENQLKTANSTLEERDIALTASAREIEAKIAALAALDSQARDAREKAIESNGALSEERRLARSLEHEVQALRRNLAEKAEAQLQLSQRLQDQERQSIAVRELGANHKLQRTRFETIIRTKAIEIQQLQNRLAALETQQAHLTESNRKLRHSCARYQSDLNEKDAKIERLHNRLNRQDLQSAAPVSSGTQTTIPEMQMHMDTRDKDVEIARLRARIAGLQLLLRRGPGQLRDAPTEASVEVAMQDLPQK